MLVVEFCSYEIIFFLKFTLHFWFLGLFIHTHQYILNLLNLLPCKSLLKKSAKISSMEHCFTFNTWRIIWSFIKYNCLLICRVISLELSILFVSNKIALALSWWNVVSQSYPCCFRNVLVHNKCNNTSFTATNYDYVEIFVLILCFIENFRISTLSMVNKPPVWPFISVCTAKVASSYQSYMVISLMFNVKLSSHLYWRYLIILNNFLQSYSSSILTLVHKNCTVGWILVISLLHRNNALEIIVCNTSNFSASIFFTLVSTVNKYYAAGVFTLFMFFIYSM